MGAVGQALLRCSWGAGLGKLGDWPFLVPFLGISFWSWALRLALHHHPRHLLLSVPPSTCPCLSASHLLPCLLGSSRLSTFSLSAPL